MILDTCFLIDLQKEFRSGNPGSATAFLNRESDTQLYISVISETEFLEGFADSDVGERLLRCYDRIEIDSRIAKQAARIRRKLRREGKLIGDFDILIAATALVAEQPLVTTDQEHFSRVPELEIIKY